MQVRFVLAFSRIALSVLAMLSKGQLSLPLTSNNIQLRGLLQYIECFFFLEKCDDVEEKIDDVHQDGPVLPVDKHLNNRPNVYISDFFSPKIEKSYYLCTLQTGQYSGPHFIGLRCL